MLTAWRAMGPMPRSPNVAEAIHTVKSWVRTMEHPWNMTVQPIPETPHGRSAGSRGRRSRVVRFKSQTTDRRLRRLEERTHFLCRLAVTLSGHPRIDAEGHFWRKVTEAGSRRLHVGARVPPIHHLLNIGADDCFASSRFNRLDPQELDEALLAEMIDGVHVSAMNSGCH